MNCPDWEERIALFAQGDLPSEELAEAERHWADCAACREFAGELQQSLAALRNAHEQPIAEVHFKAVRARVLDQIEQPRRPARRWAWIGGLAAAAAVVLLVTTLQPRPVPPPQVTLALPPVPDTPVLLPEPLAAPATPKRRAPVRRVRKPSPPEAPLMVKLITDDPNVVIYWIAN